MILNQRRSAQMLAPTLALLLMAGIIFAEHAHTRHEPLERDMPTYAVVANEVLHGRPLYLGVFDQKPPAVYITYAAAEMMTGYDRRTIFLMGVFAALLTLPGLYLAGLALTGRVAYGLCAALLWTLLGCDLVLQANQPNTEVYMNAAAVWAVVLLLRSRQDVIRWPAALVIGLLFAWATLYKPVVVTEALGLLGAYVLFPPGGKMNRLRALSRSLLAAAAIGVAWAAVVVFFAAEGHWQAFYDANVVYNRSYAGSLQANLRAALHPHALLPNYLRFCLPLIALAVVGLWVAFRRGLSWQWPSLLGLTLGTFAAVSLPGRFYPHYYQLWLPLLCLAPVYGLATLADALPARRAWLTPALGLAALLVVFVHEGSFYRESATQWSFQKYGPEFIQADQTALEIKSLLAPGETFYDSTVDPELYLETGMRPPTGIFYSEPITGGPFVKPFTARVLHDLRAAPPQLIVYLDYGTYARKNPLIWSWINAHYDPLVLTRPRAHFAFWVLRGGPLEARLRAARTASPLRS